MTWQYPARLESTAGGTSYSVVWEPLPEEPLRGGFIDLFRNVGEVLNIAMNVNDLVKEFADCVVAQEAAIAKADPITGNKFARRCNAAFEQLRSLGDEGRDALAGLLDDGRPEVRVMAAAHLLRHCGDRARAVLEAESRGKGLVAFGAAQALQRWKEGTWALDPE